MDFALEDTILAVSSPAGPGARAILRLSGPDALAIAARALAAADASSVSTWPTYSAGAGVLEFPGSDLRVPAVAYLMRAPRSYTRQDVVEFHVGGWPALVGEMVEGLLRAGARAAGPGEFTCRALLSGRLDLAQAEAVMAVVGASSEAMLRAAGDLLRGHLSREIEALADEVRDLLAEVEADLDFSDQEVPVLEPAQAAARLAAVRRRLADLGRRSRSLETFGGEARLVLAGWPNVGKSSLFNRLLEADRAIVAPESGTTRDELRAALHLADPATGEAVTVVLSDTAGLDEARDELAGKARAKAIEAIGRADLALLCLDATAPSYERMDEVLALVAAPMVAAVTKCDLAGPERATAYLESRGVRAETVPTSAATGEGVERLRGALARAVAGGTVDRESAGPVMSARHRSALEEAAKNLARAERLVREGAGEELAALELREALAALGTILGRDAEEGVLDRIFSRFCIGK